MVLISFSHLSSIFPIELVFLQFRCYFLRMFFPRYITNGIQWIFSFHYRDPGTHARTRAHTQPDQKIYYTFIFVNGKTLTRQMFHSFAETNWNANHFTRPDAIQDRANGSMHADLLLNRHQIVARKLPSSESCSFVMLNVCDSTRWHETFFCSFIWSFHLFEIPVPVITHSYDNNKQQQRTDIYTHSQYYGYNKNKTIA